MDVLIYMIILFMAIGVVGMVIFLFAGFLEDRGGKKSKIAADLIGKVTIYGFIIFVLVYLWVTGY